MDCFKIEMVPWWYWLLLFGYAGIEYLQGRRFKAGKASAPSMFEALILILSAIAIIVIKRNKEKKQ